MSTGEATVNVASHLPLMARRQPDTPAVIRQHGRGGVYRYDTMSYRELDAESDRLAHGLEAIGIRRGVRTVLMVRPGLDFFALTFALFKVAAVPVLVDPGLGMRGIARSLAEAHPEAFVGIPVAHAARLLFGWGRGSVRTLVTVGGGWLRCGHTLDAVRKLAPQDTPYPLPDVAADEIAAVLFTSGSTGPPKGTLYTHGIFSAQVAMIRELYDIRPGEVDLATFPLFALFAPALGMTSVIPEMDASRPAKADPVALAAAVRAHHVTTMFGSPALLDRLSRHGVDHGWKFPTLRRVLSAGAPVSAEIMERMTRLLPDGAQVFTPYGATESLPVCSIGSAEVLGETRQRTAEGAGVCVGRPAPGIELAILPIRDEPIPTWDDHLRLPVGQIGEITVHGPVVTPGYVNRPEATALAKIADPVRVGVWHRMGDLGYLDGQGRVWFCGRKSHRVPTSDRLLFTIPCEAVFNRHPAVRRTALVGVPAGDATEPVLCVELRPEHRKADREQVRRELLDLGAARDHTKGIRRILFHPAFPVDIRHNAKIFREKLAVWAAGRDR